MHNMYSNPLFQTWVKNVYSLCAQSVHTCGHIYTDSHQSPYPSATMGVKPQFCTQVTTSFTPYIFTVFFNKLHLLIHHLYTVSTGPIIKTKGLKRKETQ